MGKWIFDQLQKKYTKIHQGPDTFQTIYDCLINGALDQAIKVAVKAHMYNLGLMLSLLKAQTPQLVRDGVSKQVRFTHVFYH